MTLSKCRVLVTGANGFIGKNLILRLKEVSGVKFSTFVRGDNVSLLPKLLAEVDAIIHLAGENRPVDERAFTEGNSRLTSRLCDALRQEFASTGRRVPLLLSSSTQAELDNPYGRSKHLAEKAVQKLAEETGNPCVIFRLPGVFGKWCKPNYNSVVATFCHNIARGLSIQISDPMLSLKLVYVDDVVSALFAALDSPVPGYAQVKVEPEYTVTLDELAKQIRAFDDSRPKLMTERVGANFTRALYATYISYLPSDRFSYQVVQHTDKRGMFVEMLKTQDSGQFSYFTVHPGMTRGGHYHHTKTEKFLVVTGDALFRFRHLLTNELVELKTSGDMPEIVDTIPGWTHDITNTGNKELVVILWANEIFDLEKPDTVTCEI
jgi:UDP-2-acetamido-2,6-beta-L-arabino-hexul-4-ose reductase